MERRHQDVLPCAAHIIPVSPPMTPIRFASQLIRLSHHLHQGKYLFDLNPLMKSNHVIHHLLRGLEVHLFNHLDCCQRVK